MSFDGDTDMHCFRLMTAWKQIDGFGFNFNNAHDVDSAGDDSKEESIKEALAEGKEQARADCFSKGGRRLFFTLASAGRLMFYEARSSHRASPAQRVIFWPLARETSIP